MTSEAELDARAFHDVREVLAGTRRVPLGGSASKMLRILLTTGDTDAVVSPERFLVHLGINKRPSHYFRRLAPAVISALLQKAQTTVNIERPIVLGVISSTVPAHEEFPSWSHGALRVWLVPTEREVRISIRPTNDVFEPFVREDDNPPPAVPPTFSPRPHAYRDFEKAVPCPHCGTQSTRYRDLSDALVCLTCARSFVASA